MAHDHIAYDSESVNIVAVVTPHPDKVEQAREAMNAFAEKVRRDEPGCTEFLITEQAKPEGTPEFVIIERYVNQAALLCHLKSSHMKALSATVKAQGLVAKPVEMKKTRRIGGFVSKL